MGLQRNPGRMFKCRIMVLSIETIELILCPFVNWLVSPEYKFEVLILHEECQFSVVALKKDDNTIIHLSDIKYFVFQVNIHPYLRCETICSSQQIPFTQDCPKSGDLTSAMLYTS